MRKSIAEQGGSLEGQLARGVAMETTGVVCVLEQQTRWAIRVARSDATMPAKRTEVSSHPVELEGSRHPRDAIAGRIASKADTAPIAVPLSSRKTFSPATIVARCRGV